MPLFFIMVSVLSRALAFAFTSRPPLLGVRRIGSGNSKSMAKKLQHAASASAIEGEAQKKKKKNGDDAEVDPDALPFKMDDIVNLCKRKGFVFQSSEIYSPMAGFFDYGPLGVELKNNIKKLWWRDMVQRREDMCGLDSSIIGASAVWQASGHVAGFSDPMVDCKQSKLRYRADQVFWGRLETESGEEACYVSVLESDKMTEDATKAAMKKAKKEGVAGPYKPLVLRDLTEATEDIYAKIPSPATGEAGHLTPPRDFNLMFQTNVGPASDSASVAYLRPETAQGIFTNFANAQRTARMKVRVSLCGKRIHPGHLSIATQFPLIGAVWYRANRKGVPQ